MKIGSCLLLVGLCGCRASLSEETIRHHPHVQITGLAPQVVESSAAIRPGWIDRLERGAVAYVPFAGQASAVSLEEAKAQALRDLYSGVSNFISVDVRSEFELAESSSSKNGVEEASQDVREALRTRSDAQLKGVRADESYWEKVQSSPLLPDAIQYRYFAYARVPKGEILRARLQRQLSREQKSGKKLVVVLPFRGPSGGEGAAAAIRDGLVEELSRRLATRPSLHVSDPELVRALTAGERSESESQALEAVRDALLPDLVIGGSYQIQAGSLRVTYSLYGGADNRPQKSASLEARADRLFELEDKLIAALESDLVALGASATGAPPLPAGAVPPAPPKAEAFEAYAEAATLFRAGKQEEAQAAIGHALDLTPDFGRAYLRLGRILEQMGRYGSGEPPVSASASAPALVLCTAGAEFGADPERLQAEAAELPAGSKTPVGEPIDQVLSAARYGVSVEYAPEPDVPARPLSAVGAYWHAYRLGVIGGDPALALEARLALADLAVRSDRLDAATDLYQQLLVQVAAAGDLHFESLVLLGLGRVLRDRGQLQPAFETLKKALERRLLLGEKPYLLELLNELGGVAVELGLYDLARALFDKSKRIADELGDDHLSAVLANNIGVLEYRTGHSSRAVEHIGLAFGRLSDLGDAEGRIASALNLSLLDGLRGDPETARRLRGEAERLLGETGQRGRRAQLLHQVGDDAISAGDPGAGLVALIRSRALYARLGRDRDRWRVESDILAAETRLWLDRLADGAPVSPGRQSCLLAKADQLLYDFGWSGAFDPSAVPIQQNALAVRGLSDEARARDEVVWGGEEMLE